mgnify:CR=1 FL=1
MAFLKQIRSKADQVTLEADKMLRINRKQSEIGQMRKQIEQVISQLGRAAYGLHSQGSALPADLTGPCEQIDAVYAQIKQAEQEIERVRQETLPDSDLPSGTRCPACGFGIPDVAAFCPNCGSPRPKPESGLICTSCGNHMPPGTRFCANCGQPVATPDASTELSSGAEASPATAVCAGCQAEIPAQATFCPFCGTPAGALAA